MATTTTQHMQTRDDFDLRQRLVAKAELLHIDNAEAWVNLNITRLITEVVDQGQTIGDVYSYAREVRDAYIAAIPPAPGANLSAVTDGHLEAAIAGVRSTTEQPIAPEE